MKIPAPLKAFLTLTPILVLIGVTAASAQEDFFKRHPWPRLSKQPAVGMERPSRDIPLRVSNLHADTAEFTPYDTDLLGVIIGNAQWIDFDNDADLDIFVSGYDGSAPLSKMYRNTDGTFQETDIGIPPVITERGVAWGDYDNDGDFDLAMTGTLDSAGTMPVSKIFRNDGNTFVDINAGLQAVLGGVTTWVDYNLDGRLDLLIAGSPDRGSSFVTKLYRNDDTAFTESGIYFPGVWGASVDWGDYDNDGDPDLLLTGYGDWGMTSGLWRNDGASFAALSLPFEPVNFSAVSWGDFDNDGRLDFVVSGNPPGWTGLNTFTALYHSNEDGSFDLVPTTLPQLNGCGVAWGDYDNDGDLDLAINGWHDDTTNISKIFRNDGGGDFTDIGADLPGTWWGSMAWGDVDNDGRLDLLMSGGTGPQPFAAFYYNYVPWNPFYPITAVYHNNLPGANLPPSPPPNMAVHTDGDGMVFTWGAGSDDNTPVPMLSYNLRVGTSPGASDIVAPTSNLATGYRRVPEAGNTGHQTSRTLTLPPGTYFWSVQTVDNGFSGSGFTPERTTVEDIDTRWHMLSVPYDCPDWHRSVLYPASKSNAFAYQPSSYVVRDELRNGEGYWMKFDEVENPTLSGAGPGVNAITIPVTAGWNLIGTISTVVNAADVSSDPPGMVTSQFFGYADRYFSADALQPEKAYWIKVSEGGMLTLSAGPAPVSARIRIVPGTETPPPPPGGVVSGDTPPVVPSEYRLGQNYPNPFNPGTRMSYALPADAYVTLTVFNILGEIVATPVAGHRPAGSYSLDFDGRGLPSGVYFYRITAGTFTDMKKMVLAR